MIKLTAPQQAVLIAAAAHTDGVAGRPIGMKPSAAAKLAAKLVEHRLAREVRARDDAPVWREDEQGRDVSLKLLKAGHVLAAELLSAEQATDRQAAAGQNVGGTPVAVPDQGAPAPVGREGGVTDKCQTKRTLVLAMLGRRDGATMEELVTATGWLPHTTRAALSGLRKGGVALERSRRHDGATAWQLAAANTAPTASAAIAAAA